MITQLSPFNIGQKLHSLYFCCCSQMSLLHSSTISPSFLDNGRPAMNMHDIFAAGRNTANKWQKVLINELCSMFDAYKTNTKHSIFFSEVRPIMNAGNPLAVIIAKQISNDCNQRATNTPSFRTLFFILICIKICSTL